MQNYTAYEGDNVTLDCEVMSTYTPIIQWVKHYQVNGSWKSPNDDIYSIKVRRYFFIILILLGTFTFTFIILCCYIVLVRSIILCPIFCSADSRL